MEIRLRNPKNPRNLISVERKSILLLRHFFSDSLEGYVNDEKQHQFYGKLSDSTSGWDVYVRFFKIKMSQHFLSIRLIPTRAKILFIRPLPSTLNLICSQSRPKRPRRRPRSGPSSSPSRRSRRFASVWSPSTCPSPRMTSSSGTPTERTTVSGTLNPWRVPWHLLYGFLDFSLPGINFEWGDSITAFISVSTSYSYD